MWRHTSYQSNSGSMMSRTTRSKRWFRNWTRPSRPSPGRRDPEAGLGEPELGHLSDRCIVLDEQNAFVHAVILTYVRVGSAFETLGSLAWWRFRAKKS